MEDKQFFDRKYKIKTFRGQDIITVDNLRCAIEVNKSSGGELDTAQLQLWNLSETTRAAFETIGNRVIIEAGYEQYGIAQIFSGDIRSAVTIPDADTATTIELMDGANIVQDVKISKTWSGRVTMQQVISDIAREINVSVEYGTQITGHYSNGYAYNGPAMTAIQSVAAKAGAMAIIQDDSIVVYRQGSGTNRGTTAIGADSGLVGSPEKINERNNEQKQDEKPVGYRVVSLMNPSIKPVSTVVLQSKFVNGRFRVDNVTHQGSSYEGEWVTRLECYQF